MHLTEEVYDVLFHPHPELKIFYAYKHPFNEVALNVTLQVCRAAGIAKEVCGIACVASPELKLLLQLQASLIRTRSACDFTGLSYCLYCKKKRLSPL